MPAAGTLSAELKCSQTIVELLFYESTKGERMSMEDNDFRRVDHAEALPNPAITEVVIFKEGTFVQNVHTS